jgi:hypothetical protein
MTERIPSIDVIRPVLNIGEEDIAHMQRHMLDYADSLGAYAAPKMYDVIPKIFYPIDALRSVIINRSEFLQLQRYVGLDQIDEARLKELKSHIHSELAELSPTAHGKQDVPTLPTKFYRRREDGGRKFTMTIAPSPITVQERRVTKGVIQKFFELETIPEGIWASDDERTTRVWLARSTNAKAARLVHDLDAALAKGEKRLLPNSTQLGELEVRESN